MDNRFLIEFNESSAPFSFDHKHDDIILKIFFRRNQKKDELCLNTHNLINENVGTEIKQEIYIDIRLLHIILDTLLKTLLLLIFVIICVSFYFQTIFFIARKQNVKCVK